MRFINYNKNSCIEDYLLSLFSFFMPLSLLLNINTIVMILLIVFSLFSFYKSRELSFSKTWILVLYFFALTISLIYTQDIDRGLKLLVRTSPFLLIPIGISNLKKVSEKQLKIISLAFYSGNISALIISLVYALKVYPVNPLPLQNGFSYFTEFISMHPSYFSIYLLFSTALIFWVFRKNNKLTGFLKIILILVLLASQLYLKSRAGLIASCIVLILYMVFNFKKKLLFLMCLIVTAFFFLVSKFPKEKSISNRNLTESIYDRLSIWESSINIIGRNFFFGVGIGDSQFELDRQYYLDVFDHGINDKLNSHNQFLQTFLTNGIIGFVILISIFYMLLVKYKNNRDEIILYFIFPTITLMFFDSVLVLQHGILFVAFFTTVLLKYKSE